VRLEESPAYKESIFTFAPQSQAAVEYEKLCNEVISRVLEGCPPVLACAMTRTMSKELTQQSSTTYVASDPSDKLDPNPDQPRTEIGDLTELTASISEKGVLSRARQAEPGSMDDHCGERPGGPPRAGLTELPCIEMDVDESAVAEIA